MRLRLLMVLVMAVFLTGCFLPKQYKQGNLYLEEGNYAAAVQSFDEADIEKPENEKINMALVDAKTRLANQYFNEYKDISEHDLPGRISQLEMSKEQIDNAKERNDILYEAHKDDKRKPKKVTLIDIIEENASTVIGVKGKVDSSLFEEQENESKVLNIASSNKTLSDSDPVAAYEGFKPVEPYVEYMTDVSSAQKYINQKNVDHYENLGLEAIKKNRYKTATKNFEKSFEIIDGNFQGKAGLASIPAKRAINKKKFMSAHKLLKEVQGIHPKSAFVAEHLPTIRTKLIAFELKRAKKLVQRNKIKSNVEAFGVYAYIVIAAEGDKALLAPIEADYAALRKQVASNFIKRANNLNTKDKIRYSTLVLNLLQNAYRMDPEAATPYMEMASYSLAYTNGKKKLNAMVYSKSSQYAEFSLKIESSLSAQLAQAGMADVAVVSPADVGNPSFTTAELTTGAAGAKAGAEVIVVANIKRDRFKTSGFNRPTMRSSRYISGYRMVHNNEWDTAQANLKREESNYYAKQAAAEVAKRECSRLGNAFAEIACKMAIGYISNSGLSRARAKASSTPREIREDIISGYQYKEFNVAVTGEVVVGYTLYDQRNKTANDPAELKRSVNAKGRIITDVKSQDVNNNRNKRETVPDLSREQSRAQQVVINNMAIEVKKALLAHKGTRFVTQGDILSKSQMRSRAAEAYSMYLASSNGGSGKEGTRSKKAVKSYIGYSPEMIAQYGLSAKVLGPKSWPETAATLSDEEKAAVSKMAAK